jgi:o-succinylbenzoate---CoA ligase
MIVEGWLQRAAAARPGGLALQTPHGSLSYSELLAGASVGAAELAARGAKPGQRVAIALPPGLAFARALHACLLLGAVAVPVDLRLAPAEREMIAAGAAVCLEEPLSAEGHLSHAPRRPHMPRPSHAPRPPDSGGADRYAATRHDLNATAVVIHTSGTTSAPKPIELTYGNFLWSALGSAVALGLDPGERWLCALPLAHVGGLSILLRSTIYATTAVVHERFDTDAVLDALREQDVTLVSVVATTLARLLDAGLEHPPALRCALTGGGPVPTALVARAREAGVPISLTYGLTEACSQVTTTPVAAINGAPTRSTDQPRPTDQARPAASRHPTDPPALTDQPRSTDLACPLDAGPPLFCTRVQIGADGEIMVSGPTVAPGSADGEGWLRTGDLGVIDEHGRLQVTGRMADTIVSGGENVAPAEVEAVLEAHPQVLEAAVVGRPDDQWGEAVTAWVVARPGIEVDFASLTAHCARVLAPYKAPKDYMLTDEPLPRTPSGKLLRRKLLHRELQ